ncbi:MAG: lipopolysaccharide biosynthesis protein [Planctomycetota bacterium]|jgi:O-antigen/teichoic acid export membrane protein
MYKVDLPITEAKETALEELPAPQRSSLVISALSNWAPLAVNIVIAFLLTPYLIDHLGTKNFGIWALGGAFLGYSGLLRLGVGAGIMRYVPFYIGRNNQKAASEIISTALCMFLLVGLVILLTSALIAEPVARFYRAGPKLSALVLILGLAAAVECPLRIFDAALKAQERWVAVNLVAITSAVTRATGLAGCIYWGYGLVEMGYVILAVTVFSMTLLIIIFIKLCPTIHLRFSMVKFFHVRDLVLFGSLTLVTTIVYALCLDGHKLILGRMMSLEVVGIYAVAALLMNRVRGLLWAPIQVFWPRFALLDGQDNHRELSRLFRRGTLYGSIFASGIILLIVVGGPSFVELWVGEGFEAIYPVLIILSAGYLIDTSLAMNGSLLGGTGRQATQAVFATAEGVLGFTLSILLGRRMGLTGVALGFTISVALVRGLVRTWYVCNLLQESIFRYYIGCLLRPWLILGLLAILFHYTRVLEHVHSWLSLVILVIAVGFLYAVCAFGIAMNHNEKQDVLRRVRDLFIRIRVLSDIIC